MCYIVERKFCFNPTLIHQIIMEDLLVEQFDIIRNVLTTLINFKQENFVIDYLVDITINNKSVPTMLRYIKLTC